MPGALPAMLMPLFASNRGTLERPAVAFACASPASRSMVWPHLLWSTGVCTVSCPLRSRTCCSRLYTSMYS